MFQVKIIEGDSSNLEKNINAFLKTIPDKFVTDIKHINGPSEQGNVIVLVLYADRKQP